MTNGSSFPSPLHKEAVIPRATYRLQFNEHFRLAEARAIFPYLELLGVSHVYSSPLTKARAHSPHGYDVCDFCQLNPEIGTEEELADFMADLQRHGLGLVLDIVPNHMGLGGPENRWWWDILTYGPASRFAGCFDIDWQSADPELHGKVLAPVLSEDYPAALEHRQIRLDFEDGDFVLRYQTSLLPLAPNSLPEKLILVHRRKPEREEVITELNRLNQDPAQLDLLVRQQHYVLAPASVADTRLNYRRFFNIPDLAAIRTEDKGVFYATHSLVLAWLNRGWLDGLRVDHPDGLRDPLGYLHRLRNLNSRTWVVVEKILQPHENLPSNWPVDGTTGYDFLNEVGGLFIDASAEAGFTEFYQEFTGEPADFGRMCQEKKRMVLDLTLSTETNRLAGLLMQVSRQDPGSVGFNQSDLREALIEFAADLPVYRTYIRPHKRWADSEDLCQIEIAATESIRRCPGLAGQLHLIADLLRIRLRGEIQDEFVSRFQQLTAPAFAKAVEDSAFYCFNRLISLNEVGGDPANFGTSVTAFHNACRRRQSRWPRSMLATSTHDTKRSEDVRARINLLTEIPGSWFATVRRWSQINSKHRRQGWPDTNMEYCFYQSLVGAWPIPLERLQKCLEKSAREAGQHTSWLAPTPEYESALANFASGALSDGAFLADLESFLAPLQDAALVNSLAQTLLKLTAPGVPDIYQGCELWDNSLVDPDNRRPVDFRLRQELLAKATTLSAGEAWCRRDEGLAKVWLIHRALAVRNAHFGAFGPEGDYEPLVAEGAKAGHLVAFSRGGEVITIVPRLLLKLRGEWENTRLRLPLGRWKNELTMEEISGNEVLPGAILQQFPVALLARVENH